MSTTGFDPDDRLPSRPKSHAGATAHIQAQDAAARRGYAAGSRDGAREMRLKAARLAAGAECLCFLFDETTGSSAVFSEWDENNCRRLIEHDRRCPAALAEAIRRLPDGGEAPAAGPAGEGLLAGWGGGS